MKPHPFLSSAAALMLWVAPSLSPAGVTMAPAPVDDPRYTRVRWVLDRENDLEVDDKKVMMKGQVTGQLNGDTYLFSDGTGIIQLDSDIHLPLGETIIINGRIDEAYLHIGSLEIDVHDWSRPADVRR